MEGFYIGSDSICLEKVSKKSANLSLLAKGDGSEIMLYKIKSDYILTFDPSESDDTMEFFYIIEGAIEYEEDGKKTILKNGDYFYVHHLKEIVFFKTLDQVTLLYVSTEPVFHCLSNEIKELSLIVEKVEQKDIYTFNHNKRVGKYSSSIGKRMLLSKEKLENLFYASLFHDIGKIYVPDEILNKPGRLTGEEMLYIKKHPEDGSGMVKKTFLKEISNIILQHHERLDGSGYPMGLKDEEILLEAKIIAVADSYDAMTSDRPYRKGMEPQAALGEIKSLAGKFYDKSVVKIFEEIINEETIEEI